MIRDIAADNCSCFWRQVLADSLRMNTDDLEFAVPNPFDMLLQWGRASVNYELRPVLEPLSDAIEAAEKRLDQQAGEDPYDPDVQGLIDEECGFVEDLLGAAFVVAQRYITITHSWYLKVAKAAEAKVPGQWQLPPGEEKEKPAFLERFGPKLNPPATASTVSFATAANAAANYFKHESEWGSWSAAESRGGSKFTIAIVTNLGATKGSTGNCRTMATTLGIVDHKDFEPLIQLCSDWSSAVVHDVEQELKRLGLV